MIRSNILLILTVALTVLVVDAVPDPVDAKGVGFIVFFLGAYASLLTFQHEERSKYK